jgi:hypothetical protein
MKMATNGTGARLFRGAVSGATGTTALNVVSYGDMLVRGRAPSSVPARVAGILADRAGLRPLRSDDEAPPAQNRREAAGALMGYATGVGVGVGYGIVRARVGTMPLVRSALLLGLAAMTAANTPIVLLKISDPRTWSAADWISDLIPHLAYGLTVAATYDVCSGGQTAASRRADRA